MFVDISGLHLSARSTDTSFFFMARDLGDQENNKCNKLMGEMVVLLSPTAFKDWMLLCISHKHLIPVAVDYLPGKEFQGSQICLLHTFHSALKWKKGCLRCRDWAVDLTVKHKEWPNLKRRLSMTFGKLSPFLFCLRSPSSGYGCSIVLYRLKRYLAFINAWWKINSYCLCSRSWAWDVGTNLQPEEWPQLRNFGKFWGKGWGAFYNNFWGSTQCLSNSEKCFCCSVFVFFNACKLAQPSEF